MRYVSLFTGCGLLDLGLEHAGWQPVMFCERDDHCRRVLARHWPGVPVVGDVREVAADTEGDSWWVADGDAVCARGGTVGRGEDAGRSALADPVRAGTGRVARSQAGRDEVRANEWRDLDGCSTVDLVVGGFPCQPVSYAGQRKAQADDRWLWPEMARVVRALRPRLVLVENVPGLATAGLGEVIADLAGAGYDTEWFRVRASDLGAPHRRERLFIVAALADPVRAGTGRVGGSLPGTEEPCGRRQPDSGEREPLAHAHAAPPADADDGRREQRHAGIGRIPVAGTNGARTEWGDYEPAITRWEATLGRPAPAPTDDRGRLMPAFVEWLMGAPDGWTDGVSRTQRLRMLGNGVVVQVGELIGHALKDLP